MPDESRCQYQLFITDLDGTLLDDDKAIPQENQIAIQKLVDQGIHCTVFTGRSYHSGKEIVEKLGIQLPVVFQNGALIMNPITKEVIFQQFMSIDLARQIIRMGGERDFLKIAYVSFLDLPDMLVEIDLEHPYPMKSGKRFPFQEYLEHNAPRIKQVKDLYLDLNALQSQKDSNHMGGIPQICLIGDVQPLNQFIQAVEDLYSGQVSSILSSIVDGMGFLEFFGPNVSKAHALDELMKYYHVTPEQTVFIGDNLNDVELMRRVGMPVAVANAPDEVKALCKWIAPCNGQAGVAKAIDHFFFERQDG